MGRKESREISGAAVGKAIGKAVLIFMFYVPIWFVVGIFTFFVLLPAPWNAFRKTKRRRSYGGAHNFDPYFTDEEFEDLMED